LYCAYSTVLDHDAHAAFALSPSLSFFSCSLGGSTSGPKLNGNNSPMVLTMYLPSLLNIKIGVSKLRNSLKNCLHIPHGEQKPSISVATPTALKDPSVWPWITAVPKATRSAQVPTGYAAFSTFAPTMMEGSDVVDWCRRRDAPTRKSEYGPAQSC